MRCRPANSTISRVRGFTIVEILVVVAIIALLAAIGVPTFRVIKANARSTICSGKLRNIGVGLNNYFLDHGMTYPNLVAARETRDEEVPSIDTVLLEYVGDEFSF